MQAKTSKAWIPLWIDKWLFGSTRLELNPAERSVFVDLLALAGKDDGYIRANVNMPYNLRQLAGLLNVDVGLLTTTIKKCKETGKIEEPAEGIYKIKNWTEYQLSKRHKERFGEKFIPEYKRFVPCPKEFLSMATKKGLVAKHRLLVAIALNRPLTDTEIVHHIDNKPDNNELDNLLLFRNSKEHLQYQYGYEIEPVFDGRKLGGVAKNDIMTKFASLGVANNEMGVATVLQKGVATNKERKKEPKKERNTETDKKKRKKEKKNNNYIIHRKSDEGEKSDNYKIQTDIQKIVCAYKALKGFDMEDRAWDKLNFKRCSKSAKQLLEYFDNNWETVVKCLESLAKEFNHKCLEWTLETCVKWASEWKLKQEKQITEDQETW